MRFPVIAALIAATTAIALQDKKPTDPLVEARQRLQRGNYGEARDGFEKLLKHETHGPAAAIGLARAWRAEGEYSKAARRARRRPEGESRSPGSPRLEGGPVPFPRPVGRSQQGCRSGARQEREALPRPLGAGPAAPRQGRHGRRGQGGALVRARVFGRGERRQADQGCGHAAHRRPGSGRVCTLEQPPAAVQLHPQRGVPRRGSNSNPTHGRPKTSPVGCFSKSTIGPMRSMRSTMP